MIYISNTTDFKILEPTAVSLGKFDGIHRGHELLMKLLFQKKEEGLQSAAFTFDSPPGRQEGGADGKLLTTNEEKMHLFAKRGIDYLIECPFTEEIRCMEPESFIEMLVSSLHVKYIAAGEDFHFGHCRRGDFQTLLEFAEKYRYEAVIVPKIKENGRDISSTYIREEIAAGNLESANRLLGYSYFVEGKVEHGNQIGRTLGFPTVNLIPPPQKLLPPYGVYVTELFVNGKQYNGITNVGRKPTIQGENPVGVETHLFDFKEDIYGKNVSVSFLKWIRPERRFDGIEELRRQVAEDIAHTRAYFSKQ